MPQSASARVQDTGRRCSVVKALVTGAHGLLGSEFVSELNRRGDHVLALGRSDLDVTDEGAVREMVGGTAPDLVVHCAAYTAVDDAESEPDVAARVNRDGARYVAAAAHGASARFVYISTDYVFGGPADRPFRTDDPVGPVSVYARTKSMGEEAVVQETEGSALVARTGWLYGAGGKNFVDSMIGHGRTGTGLRIVDDQIGRPTWARNVARVTLELLDTEAVGVWHVADGGTASWLDLAEAAFDISGVDTPLAPVSTEEWGAAAARPPYSVLDLTRTEERVGHPMQQWRDALREYLVGSPRAPDSVPARPVVS